MSDRPDSSKELVQKAAEKYSETTSLRAAVQLIPYIGGTLDTLIGGAGQKIQQQRIAHFLDVLDDRLRVVEAPQHALSDEDLFDLIVGTLERVVKSRSKEKQARFAQVIANEISQAKGIEEAETAIRLIGDLEDIHIRILNTVHHAPLMPSPYDGRKFVTISQAIQFPINADHPHQILTKIYPNIPEIMLRLTCSELVAKGLLKDDGVGKFNSTAMEQFTTTQLATWLLTWLDQN